MALYDDRLEIISPGDLHFGITPEMLFKPHESKPWNPLIANTFYRRGHIETWGRGTLNIAELIRLAGLEPPTVEPGLDTTTVTFWLPKIIGGVTKGVTALLEHIQRYPGSRTPALADLLQTSRKNIERWIKQLRKSGLVEFVGPCRTGGYHARNQPTGKLK